MEPKIWGPHLWFFLHSMTFSYAVKKDNPTRSEKKHMYTFLESLKYVLPCICKNNYKIYFDANPPRLNSRRELFEWVVDLHNHVNEEYNREQLMKNPNVKKESLKRFYSYSEVETRYKNIYNKV
jgi:hypothetical protein